MQIPKSKRVSIDSWLRAARGERCTMRVPGICNGDPSTVVAAHSNLLLHGKGMGRKADDLFIAFACSDCHRAYDEGCGYEADFVLDCWHAGHARTLRRLHELGLLKA